MRYRIFGVGLESDVPLPELPQSPTSRPALRARLRRRSVPAATPGWRRVHRDGVMDVSRRPGEWRIRFPRLADFVVSERETLVTATADRRIPLETIRHLLIDQVVPLVLSARGQVIVHGSAVCGRGGGCLIAGESGAGKSTLAVSLAMAGWKLLSDDLVRVQIAAGGARAIAAYAGARLWPDVLSLTLAPGLTRIAHYTDKRRMPLAAFRGRTAASCVLRRMYLLAGEADAVRMETLHPREAVVELLRQATRLETASAAAERQRLETLSVLCETVPVRRLSYTRDLNRLGEVRRAIAADLATDLPPRV